MRTTVFLLCTIVLGGYAHARDIYRCVSPAGEVTLTNLKCPANTSTHLVGTYEPVPDSPYQRLDAAIQAADISSQQAREAALRAQAAANQATQMLYQGAPAEPQGYEQSGDPNVYLPAFVPGYPFDGQFDARFPGHRQRQRSYADAVYPSPHGSARQHGSPAQHGNFMKSYQHGGTRLAYGRPVPHARPSTPPPPAARPAPATARHW